MLSMLSNYFAKVKYEMTQMISFLVLFVLFVVALELADFDRLTIAEGVFMLYALG